MEYTPMACDIDLRALVIWCSVGGRNGGSGERIVRGRFFFFFLKSTEPQAVRSQQHTYSGGEMNAGVHKILRFGVI